MQPSRRLHDGPQFNVLIREDDVSQLHPLYAECQTRRQLLPFFKVFGVTRPGFDPGSPAREADILTTRPMALCLLKDNCEVLKPQVAPNELLYVTCPLGSSSLSYTPASDRLLDSAWCHITRLWPQTRWLDEFPQF